MIVKQDHRVILDFYLHPSDEALILSCFIGDENFIVFPYYGLNYNRVDLELADQIRKQTLYVENNYIHWRAPLNMDELAQQVCDEGITYISQIIQIVKGEIKVRFKLQVFEHYQYNSGETRALIIQETDEGDFCRNVAPVIESIVKGQKSNQ